MSGAPAISVAMAVHNGMPFVGEAVASILAQTFGDFEFVIGDDGSEDGTSERLRAFAAADRRIRLLRREAKSGLAASANWVVGETRAPLVAIAHADDRSYPDRLARQKALFDKTPDAVLVGSPNGAIDAQSRPVRPPALFRLRRAGDPFAPFAHSSVMFRRRAFDAAGGYRASAEFWEDLDLYLRLAEQGRILVIPDALGDVRISRVSSRLRSDARRVYEAVDAMYRVADARVAGGDHRAELARRREAGERLLPRSIVAIGSLILWSGERPEVLGAMLRHAQLRPDRETLSALAWAVWGTLHPPSLRAAIRMMLALRNRGVARAVKGRESVEWTPLRSAA